MVLKIGEKLHIITRRQFDGDVRRHFIGTVKEASETIARLEGKIFILDPVLNEFIPINEKREKIIRIGESGFVINIIPPNVNLDEIEYVFTEDHKMVVTDKKEFSMDISEFKGKC